MILSLMLIGTGWRMISIRYDDIENLPAALSSQGDGIRNLMKFIM